MGKNLDARSVKEKGVDDWLIDAPCVEKREKT